MESAAGLCDFDLFTEPDGETLRAAVKACADQLKADRGATRDRDIPF